MHSNKDHLTILPHDSSNDLIACKMSKALISKIDDLMNVVPDLSTYGM